MEFTYETNDTINNFSVAEFSLNDVFYYTISISFNELHIPKEFTIKFNIPMLDTS